MTLVSGEKCKKIQRIKIIICITFVVETKFMQLCVKIFPPLTEKHQQMSHSLWKGISLTFSPPYSVVLISPYFGVVPTPLFPGFIEGKNRAWKLKDIQKKILSWC